jgi:hypothetical protein
MANPVMRAKMAVFTYDAARTALETANKNLLEANTAFTKLKLLKKIPHITAFQMAATTLCAAKTVAAAAAETAERAGDALKIAVLTATECSCVTEIEESVVDCVTDTYICEVCNKYAVKMD